MSKKLASAAIIIALEGDTTMSLVADGLFSFIFSTKFLITFLL